MCGVGRRTFCFATTPRLRVHVPLVVLSLHDGHVARQLDVRVLVAGGVLLGGEVEERETLLVGGLPALDARGVADLDGLQPGIHLELPLDVLCVRRQRDGGVGLVERGGPEEHDDPVGGPGAEDADADAPRRQVPVPDAPHAIADLLVLEPQLARDLRLVLAHGDAVEDLFVLLRVCRPREVLLETSQHRLGVEFVERVRV